MTKQKPGIIIFSVDSTNLIGLLIDTFLAETNHKQNLIYVIYDNKNTLTINILDEANMS